MRRFVRHPVAIPIEVRTYDRPEHVTRDVHNVSQGGLAFYSSQALQPGAVVEVLIPCVRPPFETKARVVWCQAVEGGFDVGVGFLSAEDAFRAHMVEQVCHIEHYRKLVREREGRLLSPNDAAREWIGKYAEEFPPPGAEDTD